MDATKVNGLIDAFEGLTPEEKGEALKRLLSSIDRGKNITVEVDENKPDHFTITGDANEVGQAFLKVVGSVEAAFMGSIERAAEHPYSSPGQSSTWGQDAAALIESLDLGDYSNVGDSVEWIKQQRAAQNARRLGNRDSGE